MSASTKKKLRKEQKAAALTERQQAEQAQAKKLKRNSILFICIISLVLVAFLGIVGYRWFTNNHILERANTAAVIGGEELNSVEFNYYYRDAINETYNEWYSTAYEYSELLGEDIDETIKGLTGFDPKQPLNEQKVEEDGDQTWTDYFLDIALENAREDMALINAAKDAGFKLPEEQRQILENQENNLTAYAQIYGFYTVRDYLVAMYGDPASQDSYLEYLENTMLADAYLEHYTNEMNSKIYDADTIAAHESEAPENYNGYSYNYIYLSQSSFSDKVDESLEGDEKTEACRKAAKEAAETLKSAATVEEFNEAIAALEISTTSSTAQTNQVHSAVSVIPVRDWLAEGGHTEGDIAVIPNESTVTDEDGKENTVINGYYVVRYISSTDNKNPVSNIRHLLVSFDPDDSGVEVTDEIKATTLQKAEELLAQWESGEKTEASFEALVRENSDDNADEGGLYTDVGAHTNFVEPFLNWCIDPARSTGDCEIVETEYGYHIMYYCGLNDYTYRDSLIMAELRSADLADWQAALIEATDAKLESTKYLDVDLVMSEGE